MLWEHEYRYFRATEAEKQKILEELRRVLEAESKVLLAVVFGSFVELESFRDVDVAVYTLDTSLDYIAKLGAKLELALAIPVDVVPLSEIDPYFRLAVLTRGKVVLEKTPGLYEALLSQTHDEIQLMELEKTRSAGRQKHEQRHDPPAVPEESEGALLYEPGNAGQHGSQSFESTAYMSSRRRAG